MSAIMTSIFGAAYLIVIGNYWGSSGLGIFALCVSIYFVSSIVCNLGIHAAVLYEVAASGEDKRRASAFAYSALSTSFLLGIIGGALGFILAPLFAKIFHQPQMTAMVRLFSVALPLFLLNKTALGILNAHRRMRFIAAINVIRGGMILLYLIAVAVFGADLRTIPYGFIIAESTILFLLFTACLRTHKLCAPSFIQAKELMSFGWKAALSGAIGDLNSRLDIIVIGLFWDAAIVGIYSVASAIARGLLIIPGAMQRVTNPLVVQLYSSNEKEKLHRTMDVLTRIGTSGFVVLGFIILIAMPSLLKLVYPGQTEMLGALVPLYFLLPGTVIFSGIAMIGSAPSSSIGKPENAVKLVSVVLGVNLVLNFSLVPFFAASGAAIATTLSLIVGLVYFSYLCKRFLDFRVPLAKLLILFILICLAITSVAVFESIVPRMVLLSTGLLTIIMALLVLGFVQKSDWELVRSILPWKSRPPSYPVRP